MEATLPDLQNKKIKAPKVSFPNVQHSLAAVKFHCKLEYNNVQSTLFVSNFAGRGKKLMKAGVGIKNLAIETGSHYRKSGYG